MPDVEKMRRQREKEYQARIDAERAERRIKEQREREMRAREHERRRIEIMTMEKHDAKKAAEIAEGERKSKEALKEVEDRRRQQQSQTHNP